MIQAIATVLSSLIITFGGGVVVKQYQNRLDDARDKRVREELQLREEAARQENERQEAAVRQEHARQGEVRRRQDVSVQMMEVAYRFYMPLQEVYWRLRHGQEKPRHDPDADSGAYLRLDRFYESFRIDSRVLEAKLDAYYPDGIARWYWHGVIDTLVVRYYAIAQPAARFEEVISRHGQHVTLEADMKKIPQVVREKLLNIEGLRDPGLVVASFERLLDLALRQVMEREEGVAILSHPEPASLTHDRTRGHSAGARTAM